MLVGRNIGNFGDSGSGFFSDIISIGTKSEIFDVAYSAFDLAQPPTYSSGDLLIVFLSGLSAEQPTNSNNGWTSSAFRSQCIWYAKMADVDASDNFRIAERVSTGVRGYGQMIAVSIKGNDHLITNHENGETLTGGGYPPDYDFFYPAISVQTMTGENIILTAGRKVMTASVSFRGADPPLDYVDGGKASGRAIAWGIKRTDEPVALSRGSFNPTVNEVLGQYGAAIRFRILNT